MATHDLITKYRAKNVVCRFCNEHCGDEPCEPSECKWMIAIDAEHSVNAVEVVRCKDCKHWLKDFVGCTEHIGRCEWAGYMVGANGFCNYGERREDDGTSPV